MDEELTRDIQSLPMNIFLEKSLIKTDGFIISSLCNKNDFYKLKPSHEMTIDLRYDGKWKDREGNNYEIENIDNQNLEYLDVCLKILNGKQEITDQET